MSNVPSAFRAKLCIVAQWCRAHAETIEGSERAQWQKFAAFLELLAGAS
ncbi:MAG TPA: hypothetical protein VHZ78_06660 [Rhizomicrobium sp.]|nr:hypothetical protein [Rhizomicrobium sp.]